MKIIYPPLILKFGLATKAQKKGIITSSGRHQIAISFVKDEFYGFMALTFWR